MDAVDLSSQRIREYSLSNDRAARVFRELWSCNGATYSAYRAYLSTLSSGPPGAPTSGAQGQGDGHTRAPMPAAYAAPKYTFDGVKLICDASRREITALSFANVRGDLLAFANQDGDVWLLQMAPEEPQQQKAETGETVISKLPKVHVRAVLGLDWSFDNSQLLSVGEDGAACIWDTSGGGSCIRSLALRIPLLCCRFHRLNPNLAILGTATGWLEIYNCSAGTLHLKYQVSGAFQRELQVSAVEVSNHHVFVGDSLGYLHLYKSEMQDGKLQKLVWQVKLYISRSPKAPIIQIEFVPFCRATDTPMLLCTSRDGTLSLIRVHEKHHRIDLYCACSTAAMAHDIRAAVCPLSAIQDVPRVTMGSEDSNVYVFNMAAGSTKPGVVNTLKGHRSPVVGVSFAFDESLLASGDAAGTLIVWRRSATQGSAA